MSPTVVALGAGLAAFFSAILATAGVRAFAHRMNIVNAPNAIVPQHTRPVAYLGGVGVVAGAAAGLVTATFLGAEDSAPTPLVMGTLLFLTLGVYDDVRPLRPARKLVLQLVAALGMALLGLRPGVSESPVLDVALASLVLVVGVNAVNLTDVCDGLVAGLAALALACWGVLDPSLRVIAWSGAGACVGFLFFNRPPASIFLGDAGSHALGFALAGVTLLSANRHVSVSLLAAGRARRRCLFVRARLPRGGARAQGPSLLAG